MKYLFGAAILVAGVGTWVRVRGHVVADAKPIAAKGVGTQPGGVRSGVAFTGFRSTSEDEIVGFSGGCFWGAEEAFRKAPGVLATAVGYTGGSSPFPSYELAHRTGHLETVLVEFNPKKVSFSTLMNTYWRLPRAMAVETTNRKKTSYGAAIWVYDAVQQKQAEASRDALERSGHKKLAVRILAAQPFYLAEAYHQQYDEKSGTEMCPTP